MAEETAAEEGHQLPLAYRSPWATTRIPAESLFIASRSVEGHFQAPFAIESRPSRALPGYRILRCERFGADQDSYTIKRWIEALCGLGKARARILRIHVELYIRDLALRTGAEELLAAVGFHPLPVPRRYRLTPALELAPDIESLFAGLHATARRHIRAVSRHGMIIRTIDSAEWISRMKELERETRSRTRGPIPRRNWAAILGLSHRYPNESRVVGSFLPVPGGGECLLAFAWGCRHGTAGIYETGASTRTTEIKAPLSYALIWDLVTWARANGATWFDLGGISTGTHGSGDLLGGISDFKRYFTRETVDVGGEWVFEPSPFRANLARMVSHGAEWVVNRAAGLRTYCNAVIRPRKRNGNE